jgi:hypothetical protein
MKIKIGDILQLQNNGIIPGLLYGKGNVKVKITNVSQDPIILSDSEIIESDVRNGAFQVGNKFKLFPYEGMLIAESNK